jgi:hypothetical protein
MRFAKPCYRPSRGVWYLTLGGTQHNLGPDREQALERYRALINQPRPKKVAGDSLVGVIDAFLDWCEKHRAPDTYEWYRYWLQRFVSAVPAELKTTQLRPFHVQQWIDSYDDLGPGSKRNHCRAVQRAMRWSADRSPFPGKCRMSMFNSMSDNPGAVHFGHQEPPSGTGASITSGATFQSSSGDTASLATKTDDISTDCQPPPNAR